MQRWFASLAIVVVVVVDVVVVVVVVVVLLWFASLATCLATYPTSKLAALQPATNTC